jgi:hypothetical protein
MIIVKLIGGLGNQMFQYALGRHLALINNTSLKLDLTQLEERPNDNNYTFRNFELDKYNLQAQIATKKDIAFFFPNGFITKVTFYRVMKRLRLIGIINETGFEFHQEILSTRKSVYLSGYWQSEKYFSSISGIIKQDFTIKGYLLTDIFNSGRLKDIISKISQTNSVTIHFRRGDYVTDPLIKEHHGECSPDYYQRAISFIKTKTKLPHFFLFSDDSDWLKINIPLTESFTIIENNEGFLDLYLMSLCKHNIIANSSFSWWGAWLNNNSEKIVIAPQKWFANDETNKQTKDLIPDKWIRI